MIRQHLAKQKHVRKNRFRLHKDRRGAVLPIMVASIVLLLVMAAFAVDVAYMQLTRTQLRAAADAAAKAGVQSLTSSQDLNVARAAAVNMAAQNQVAGKGLVLATGDMQFGQSLYQSNGSWTFNAGLTPYSALRVNPSLSAGNANGVVNLFFGKMLGTNTFSTSTISVASIYEQEVVLVLDRSHSMCFDLSGTIWTYPPPIYTNVNLGVESKPQPGSRWLALQTAVQEFVNVLSTTGSPPRVAVVTWGSDIGTSTPEFALTGQTAVAVTTDLGLTNTMSLVTSAVNAHSSNVMLGGTNMSAGIDQGVSVLTASGTKPYADKVMILMTDGQWNAGRDPVLAAQDAAAANVTIHTIGFLPDGDSTTLSDVASTTGGKHYYASDSVTLTAAFKAVALSLPVVLTQ